MGQSILVTGADGFLGQKLVHHLLAHGHTVYSHTLNDGDIADSFSCDAPVQHVFHLAARTFVPKSWENPSLFYRTNVQGTVNVLEFCRKTGASLTYPSTYVYGSPHYLPIDEHHPVDPNSPYNHSKYLAEELCSFYGKVFQIKVCILRIFNIYGEGQSDNFLIPEIIKQVLDPSKEEITLKDLHPKRDYVYVKDVLDAFLRSMSISEPFSLFNIGSGVSYSVVEVATMIMETIGIRKPIKGEGLRRQDEVMDVYASLENVKIQLHWEPRWSLAAGLEDMI